MTKGAFNKKKNFSIRKLDFNLYKKLVKCCTGAASFGAATWTLRKIDHKQLAGFEMWCWMTVQKISWTDPVKNEELRSITWRQGRNEYLTYNKTQEG